MQASSVIIATSKGSTVHLGCESGTICGANFRNGRFSPVKLVDAVPTCKRCLKIMAAEIEQAHAEAVEQNMAVESYRRSVETAEAITTIQLRKAANRDAILAQDWAEALTEDAARARTEAYEINEVVTVERETQQALIESGATPEKAARLAMRMRASVQPGQITYEYQRLVNRNRDALPPIQIPMRTPFGPVAVVVTEENRMALGFEAAGRYLGAKLLR